MFDTMGTTLLASMFQIVHIGAVKRCLDRFLAGWCQFMPILVFTFLFVYAAVS